MATVSERVAANVLEAQRFSRKHFVLELNFSEASVHDIEEQVDTVSYTIRGGNSPENIEMLSRAWGSYLGEIIRRKHGGEWVALGEGEQERLALRTPQGDLFPLEQVRRRLTEGASANLEQYLQDATRMY